MQKRAQIIVRGNVQGVSYRIWTREQAEELGLTGFARNEPDGTVLIVVEGQEAKINQLINRCSRGPELADIKDMKVEWSAYEGKFSGFEIY